MSFYGEQPKLNELNLKFSAYYPNRFTLNSNIDEVKIGEYILISYYIEEMTTEDQELKLIPGKYAWNSTDLEDGTITYKLAEGYKNNLSIDLNEYHNTYHNTVWQKVGFNGETTYIMIAELNSIAPQLDINFNTSGKIIENNNITPDLPVRYVYTIKDQWWEDNEPTIQNLITYLSKQENKTDKDAILTQDNGKPKASLLQLNQPEIDLSQSSELGYKIRVPQIPNFIFNLQNENRQTNDSINIAYESQTDSYVVNMYLGKIQWLMDNMQKNGVNKHTFLTEYWATGVGQN